MPQCSDDPAFIKTEAKVSELLGSLNSKDNLHAWLEGLSENPSAQMSCLKTVSDMRVQVEDAERYHEARNARINEMIAKLFQRYQSYGFTDLTLEDYGKRMYSQLDFELRAGREPWLMFDAPYYPPLFDQCDSTEYNSLI